jgi:hypothetical protein
VYEDKRHHGLDRKESNWTVRQKAPEGEGRMDKRPTTW